jgi:hypothetical protein
LTKTETRDVEARRALAIFLSERGLSLPDHLESKPMLARIVFWDGWGEGLRLATVTFKTQTKAFVEVPWLELLAEPLEKYPQALRGPANDEVDLEARRRWRLLVEPLI